MSVYPAALPTVRPAVRSAFEQGSGGGAASIIAGLFAQGQQGFWLPFTDFASLTQDSAGTLPYTALEQPVGRVLDRSGRGNHASQVTSTARGVVSARVNMFTKSEQFDDVAWSKAAGTISANSTTAPDGTLTADLFTESTANAQHYVLQTVVSGTGRATLTFHVKPNGRTRVGVRSEQPQLTSLSARFDLTGSGSVVSGTGTITALANGWYRCTATSTGNGNGASGYHLIQTLGPADADVYTGDGVSGIYVWGAQLETGTAFTTYQRVNTPTDYDSVGFPKYLRLDGTDDNYTCGGGGSTTGFYYSDVIRPNGAGARTLFYNSVFGLKSGLLISLISNKFSVAIGNGSTYVPLLSAETLTSGELVHVAAWDDLTNIYLQINGGTIQSMARPAMPAGPPTINLYNTGAFEHFNGQATEPIYRAGPPPSAYERSVIRAYQMQKAGML